MKRIILNALFSTFFVTMITPLATGQKENRLDFWVHQQQLNRSITKSTLFNTSSYRYNDHSEVSTALEDFQILNLKPESLTQLANRNTKDVLISIPYQGREIQLRMSEAKVTSEDYTVTSTSGIHHSVEAKHYRGVIEGSRNSIAALSIIEGQVFGIFGDDSGDYNLGKLEDGTENYILYKAADMIADLAHDCGVDDSDFQGQDPNTNFDANQRTVGDVCRKVRLYWVGDNDLFTNKGSVGATEAFLLAVFNQLAALYQQDGILIELSGTKIWDTADNYPETSSSAALNAFEAAWNTAGNNFNGDLAHLVALDGNGNGGIAGLNVLCDRSNAYGYSEINATYSNIPAYSWTINVLAHEIGHNLGSRHTHACVWNGDNTKIDNCGGHYEDPPGTFPYNDTTCPDIVVEPAGGGTTMSYCQLTATGVDMNKGFHPQVKTLIHSRINAATCLQSTMNLSTSVTDICAPATGTVNLTVSGGTAGYGYSWMPGGSSSQDVTGITAADTYTVLVTDANTCTATTSAAVALLSPPGVGSPTTLQNISGSGNLSLSTTGTSLGADEVLAWWVTKSAAISTSVTNQATLDAAAGAATIQPTNDGSAIGMNPSVLFTAADLAGGLAYDCNNMDASATYYATPVVSASRTAIPDANCVIGSGGGGNITFNGYAGKYTIISPASVSCRPNPLHGLPTYTISVTVSGYSGPAGELSVIVRNNGTGGNTIISDWFKTGDDTFNYTQNMVSNYSPNDPGDPSWATGLTAIAWHEGGNGMAGGTVSMSLNITYPGLTAITFPTVSYSDCAFGVPVTFKCDAPCTAPTTIPTAAATHTATSECTDGAGWTHYWDNVNGTDGDADDLLLISVKKNGNNIGSVGDGTFSLTLKAGSGASQITSPTAPYVSNTNPWWVFNRFWNLDPTTEPTSNVSVRFYYTSADYTAVVNQVPAIAHTDMYFWKINDVAANYNGDPTAGHSGVPLAGAYSADGFWQYSNGATASTPIGYIQPML